MLKVIGKNTDMKKAFGCIDVTLVEQYLIQLMASMYTPMKNGIRETITEVIPEYPVILIG